MSPWCHTFQISSPCWECPSSICFPELSPELRAYTIEGSLTFPCICLRVILNLTQPKKNSWCHPKSIAPLSSDPHLSNWHLPLSCLYCILDFFFPLLHIQSISKSCLLYFYLKCFKSVHCSNCCLSLPPGYQYKLLSFFLGYCIRLLTTLLPSLVPPISQYPNSSQHSL